MLVEYGRLGHVGHFPCDSPRERDSAVVVRTPRGVELGRVLRATGSGEASGEFVRGATAGDLADADRHAKRAEAILAEAVGLCAGSPVAVVDCELPLDGPAVLHLLPFAACDLDGVLHALAGQFALPVRVLDVSRRVEVEPVKSGCGSGGCSTGGCGSGGCSTGGCSRKQVKSADELTSYFAGLREQMDGLARRRLPLG